MRIVKIVIEQTCNQFNRYTGNHHHPIQPLVSQFSHNRKFLALKYKYLIDFYQLLLINFFQYVFHYIFYYSDHTVRY